MLGMNKITGKNLDGIEHLKQSIIDILTTRLNTRVMRRDYGSKLAELLDNPMDSIFKLEIIAATADALNRWEPRIKVEKVEVFADNTKGVVELDITGLYLPDGNSIKISGLKIK